MGTGPYAMYETDAALELNGVELDFGSFSITIARAGSSNKQYQSALDAALRPHRRQVDAGTLSEEISENILRTVFARTIVKGWKNVTDRDGNVLPFSSEAVEGLFKDLPDLFTEIRTAATQVSNFRKEQQVADAKK